MRKSFMFVLGLLLATGVLVAQGHDNMVEKKAKDTVIFSSDTRVGQELLKAGNYRVSCDRQTVTFEPVAGESWGDQSSAKGSKKTFLCKGTPLSSTVARTEARVSDKDGVKVLSSLVLKGSNIEHTFD